jgi:phage tail sheath protein FI
MSLLKVSNSFTKGWRSRSSKKIMAALLCPGVYYQTVDFGDQGIAPLRTDIAGFVGIASKGPINLAIPIESWKQFTTWFGGFCTAGFLGYSVRAFFENGGRRCWVVRVASDDPISGAVWASHDLSDASGPVWKVRASSEGVWGNAISFRIRERNPAQSIIVATDVLGQFSVVNSVSGFSRGDLVRIRLESGETFWRVLSETDAANKKLIWVHPEPVKRLPYDSALPQGSTSAGFIESVDYSLEVFDGGRSVGLYKGLSLIKESRNYGPDLFQAVAVQTDPITGRKIARAPNHIVIDELRQDLFRLGGLETNPTQTNGLSGGADGLSALSTYDFIGEQPADSDSNAVVRSKVRGVRVLESISEVSILATPDAFVRPISLNATVYPAPCVADPCLKNPPAVQLPIVRPVGDQPPLFGEEQAFVIQSAMVDQCERLRDRFAILDPPFETAMGDVPGIAAIREWRSRFDTQFAAIYYPWVKVLDPLREEIGAARLLPPSGHVVGGFAKSDSEIGVHKAPANIEIQWAIDTSTHPNAVQHGVLNDEGINVIRLSPGRGVRTMGARTISSDLSWRFVNVRRLMSMIEKALEISLQWATFEPNNSMTRMRATMSITLLLSSLQEAGAFAGATPSESFYVRCDPNNNPQRTVDLGELIVEVGVAPAKPFEFVVLRVGRVHESIAVAELNSSSGFSVAGV